MAICYLCGIELFKNKNKSKDHVPPDCIFPDIKPLNLITIPCCIKCNKQFEKLDEKMRNFFAILAGEKSHSLGKKVKRVLLRNKAKLDDFVSYTQEHPTSKDKNGFPLLTFYFASDELNPWLIRITKGLSFIRNNKRLENVKCTVKKHPNIYPPPSKAYQMDEGLEYRPYFVYHTHTDVMTQNLQHWIFIFYDRLVFQVSYNI